MTFLDMWESLLQHEGENTPEISAGYRLRALVDLVMDTKKLNASDDRFIKALKATGATAILRSMFGVQPNEPTTQGKAKRALPPFEEASRAIFG